MNPKRKINGFCNRVSRHWQLSHVLGYPPELQLVPTNACNLRCKFCTKTYYKTSNSQLAPEVYARVKKELFKSIRVVDLQGLGEPLLSPLFPQLLEDAQSYGLSIRFVTNATLFTRELIRKLVAIGAEVTISLDGACPKTHEESRPGADFATIMQAFADFQAEQQRLRNPQFKLCINTVVSQKNVEEVDGILEIAASHGVGVLTLINPGVGERQDEFAQAAISRHAELLSKRIERLVRKARQSGIELCYPEFVSAASETKSAPSSSLERKEAKTARGRLFPANCYDPWRLIYVDVDGWVRPCCRAIWIGMGNVLEKSLREIWNNAHYRKLRKSINSNNPPQFCRTCTLQWGITQGDEFFMQKLAAHGIELPEPPEIGEMYRSENE